MKENMESTHKKSLNPELAHYQHCLSFLCTPRPDIVEISSYFKGFSTKGCLENLKHVPLK